MTFKVPVVFVVFILFFNTLHSQVTNPATYFGYQIGEKFVRHHQVVNYFKSESKQNPNNVVYQEYGVTNEGNPLFVIIVSTKNNIQQLEKIRTKHVSLIGKNNLPKNESLDKCIVWLSYNVHGNEASGTDAAIQTYYEIITDPDFEKKFEDIVLIIDPCLNPDGRERYVNWYNSVIGSKPNIDVWTREHQEPWPGGRSNHYYFDLNRDWAWQTQIESVARMKLYHQWMPQVHADFHEQSYNIPYYFAPAAEPYHTAITSFQRSFQKIIGKKISERFDQNGWLYFTNERFDLFYPSYGDTYPIYNGAIGMTFEQAGGKSAGSAVKTKEDEILTLLDRIQHHTISAIATLDAIRENTITINQEFQRYFIGNSDKRLFNFAIQREDYEKGRSLRSLLDKNQITYTYSVKNDRSSTLQIPLHQTKNTLLNILMEEKSTLSDSLTYDITAWNIPKIYGLNYTITTMKDQGNSIQPNSIVLPDTYGYAIDWQGGNSAKALTYLLENGIKVRVADQPFTIDGQKYRQGTLLIIKEGTNKNKKLVDITNHVLTTYDIDITPLTGGMVESGHDMGSEMVRLLKKPNIVLLSGKGTSSLSVGEVWYHLDKELDYPVQLVNMEQFNYIPLSEVDIIILPDGYYSFLKEENISNQLEQWVAKGGKIIALESAVDQLSALKWIQFKRKEIGKDSSLQNKYTAIKTYEDRERSFVSGSIPGAIYKVNLDNSHPLAFGYPNYYYSLKQGNNFYEYIKNRGWNVGTIQQTPETVGFIGAKIKNSFKDATVFGVQDIGKGHVIFLTDDVLFRNFWENGKLMFDNAVFMVGQ